jgi:hypothetical protein
MTGADAEREMGAKEHARLSNTTQSGGVNVVLGAPGRRCAPALYTYTHAERDERMHPSTHNRGG